MGAIRDLNFTLILGYLTGLIFTPNPLKFTPFLTWKSFYTLYACAIGTTSVVFNLDYRINIFPYLVSKATERSDFARTLLQGFVLAHVALVGLLRLYLFLRAKPISALICSVANAHVHKGGYSKPRMSMVVLLVLTVGHIVLHAVASFSFDRSRSWFHALDSVGYAILALCGYGLHCISSLVAFALISDLLTGLVAAFEDLIVKIERGKMGNGLTEGALTDDGTTTKVAWKLETTELRRRFLEIAGLFERFDRLLGPAILLTVVLSSMAVVQVLNEVWNVGYGLGTDVVSSLPWANLMQHGACLMLLDTGYKAKRRVSGGSCAFVNCNPDLSIANSVKF